jgi:CubicO group peptidase (beta-lactamase class C family)
MKKILKTLAKILGVTVLLLILVIGGYFLLKPKPPQAPETVANITEAEAYVEELVEFGTPPGISLVVVKDGDIVYSKGFGLADGPNNIPAASETVYKWMSTTKIFTATAILQLHDHNKLDINDPVADYLPFFDVVYPSENSEIITIRHLLNHSSGMLDNFPAVIGWMHLENSSQLDQTDLLEEVFTDYNELIFEPGDHSEYTNVGYMTLGAIIEAVSGQTYQEYVIENIFQPLGMNHSNFLYTDEMLPFAAVGSHPRISIESVMLRFLYDDFDPFIREKTGGKMWFNRFYADSDPPTGMIASVTDLAGFMLAYLNDGELDGVSILSPETVAMMTYNSHIISVPTNQIETPFHGLGWGIYPQEESADGRMYIFHDGGGPGFGSNMRLYPEESLGLVIAANDTTYNHSEILDLFASLDW